MALKKPRVEVQHAEVCRRLERQIELYGSLRKAAFGTGVSPAYYSAALLGKKTVGPKLLKPLGLGREVRKVITYFQKAK